MCVVLERLLALHMQGPYGQPPTHAPVAVDAVCHCVHARMCSRAPQWCSRPALQSCRHWAFLCVDFVLLLVSRASPAVLPNHTVSQPTSHAHQAWFTVSERVALGAPTSLQPSLGSKARHFRNISSSSRLAASGLSLPWPAFCCPSRPNLARTLLGACSRAISEFVGPSKARHCLIASLPDK